MPDLSPYYVFILPITVGLIVQITKFVVFCLKHGWNIRYIMTHGHMPSAHTGFALSVLTSVGYYEGIHTGAFAVAIALAIIIIDDAARLRMYMGDQGKYLNMLIKELKIDEKKFPRLKERMGHRVSEIIVGGIYGFLLTIILIKLLG